MNSWRFCTFWNFTNFSGISSPLSSCAGVRVISWNVEGKEMKKGERNLFWSTWVDVIPTALSKSTVVGWFMKIRTFFGPLSLGALNLMLWIIVLSWSIYVTFLIYTWASGPWQVGWRQGQGSTAHHNQTGGTQDLSRDVNCQSLAQQRQGLMTHHLHEDNQNRGVHHLHWGTRCLGHLQMYSTQSFPATVSVSIYHIINMHLDSRLSISIPAHSFIMFFDLCFQSRIISSLHLVNRRTLPVFASIRLDYVQTYAELLRWSDQADWECSGKVSNIKKLQLTWRT